MDRPTTALIADDEPAIRRLISEILRMRGYVTSDVDDGCAAVERARAERPDVIVIDHGLPGIRGVDVLEELKDEPATAGIPVILVTGWHDEALEVRALGRGAHAVVHKPFDMHKFADVVDAAVIISQRNGLTRASPG